MMTDVEVAELYVLVWKLRCEIILTARGNKKELTPDQLQVIAEANEAETRLREELRSRAQENT